MTNPLDFEHFLLKKIRNLSFSWGVRVAPTNQVVRRVTCPALLRLPFTTPCIPMVTVSCKSSSITGLALASRHVLIRIYEKREDTSRRHFHDISDVKLSFWRYSYHSSRTFIDLRKEMVLILLKRFSPRVDPQGRLTFTVSDFLFGRLLLIESSLS